MQIPSLEAAGGAVSEAGNSSRPTVSAQPTPEGASVQPAPEAEAPPDSEALLAERLRLSLQKEQIEQQRRAVDSELAELKSGRLPKRTSGRAKRAGSQRAARAGSQRAARAGSQRARQMASGERTSRRLGTIHGRRSSLGAFMVFAAVVGVVGLVAYASSTGGDTTASAGGEIPELAALREKAEAGDAAAMLNLGYLYAKGTGGRKDLAAAERWFQRAAKEGDAEVNATAVVHLEELRNGRYSTGPAGGGGSAPTQNPSPGGTAKQPGEPGGKTPAQPTRTPEEQREQERIGEAVAKTLGEAELMIAEKQPERMAEALDLLTGLEQRFKLAPDLAQRVEDTRARAVEQAKRVVGDVELAASRAIEEGSYAEAAGSIEAMGQLLDPLPVNLRALWDRAKRELARTQRAAQEEEEARAAEARAEYNEALAEREQTKKELSLRVRKRALAWLESRSPENLHCPKCEGAGTIECDGCDGSGRETYGSGTRRCVKCAGERQVPCPKGFKGFRKTKLRAVFWDCLSPTARKGKKGREFYEGVASGKELSEVLGREPLVVRNPDIRTVAVLSDRVRITATLDQGVEKNVAGRNKSHTSEWIFEGGKVYLKTIDDTNPEALLFDLPDPDYAPDPSAAPAKSVTDLVAMLEQLHAERAELTNLGWTQAKQAFDRELERFEIADAAVVSEAVGGAGVYVTATVAEHTVTLRFPKAVAGELEQLRRGDVVEFRGTLTRWAQLGRGAWRLDFDGPKLVR